MNGKTAKRLRRQARSATVGEPMTGYGKQVHKHKRYKWTLRLDDKCTRKLYQAMK